MCFYSIAIRTGFCDSEVEDTDHGKYTWNETQVGTTDEQECTYGNKEEDSNGKATRYCGSTGWMDYDGSACISRASYELLLLSKVHLKIQRHNPIQYDIKNAISSHK